MTEDEYLALVERVQQAMTVEPFRPQVTDVVLLISEWRMLHDQCERAARLLRANQTSQGVSEAMVNDVLGVLYGRW